MIRLTLVVGLLAALSASAARAQSPQLLHDMTGSRGLVVHGKAGFIGALPGGPFAPIAGELGRSVALVDLNGDGFDDLVAGAPRLPVSTQSQVLDEAGHVYILFGSADLGAPGSGADFELDPIDDGTALNLFGDPGDRAGSSVAAAGDVNGDGLQDVIIGAPNRTVAGRTSAGGAYILFGATDLATLDTDLWLSDLALAPVNRALFVQGAREFAAAGTSVSGDVDVNNDGLSDVVLGAPLDSTDGKMQNGTAAILYGQAGFPTLHLFDLATLAAGEGTEVRGTGEFQLLGFSVAGLGRFDAVLPMTNDDTHPTLGDDVALGAPGTESGTQLLAGATYVLRGVVSGSHDAGYTTADFGNGPFKAGVVYLGAALGDQAGSSVARIGHLDVLAGSGPVQLAISAPFNDGIGKADSGSAYIVYGGGAPQGVDLGALSSGAGATIWGSATSGGQRGVSVSDAGDFDSDGVRDVAIGHANQALSSGAKTFVAAGRLRLVDGALLFAARAPAYLGNFNVPWSVLEFSGEFAGDFAGAALAVGDLNGDGKSDVAVGAPGAASAPKFGDLTGVARLESGRAHVVYGEALRLDGLSPATSHFGGPPVTISAQGVPASVDVLVDGQSATILAVVAGASGSITFAPPPPLSPGALADVTVLSDSGSDELTDALQYELLAVTTGPTPPSGFAGGAVSFTGEAFSTIADTEVRIDGFPATITAVDGLLGTLSIELPSGPAGAVPLEVVVENSNGSVTLPGAFTYLPLVVQSVLPTQGAQTSGIHVVGATPYPGEPSVPVTVEVEVAGGGSLPPGDVEVEFGTAVLGFRAGTDPQVSGDSVTVGLPPFLLGPQDVLVDVRVRVISTGDEGQLPGAFTYLASDFTELPQLALPGLGAEPPAALMAGSFTNGGQIIFVLRGLQGANALDESVFYSNALAVPPIPMLGGQLGVEPITEQIVLMPGNATELHVSQDMPTDIPPSADGMPVYLQVITRESDGVVTVHGFSNILVMTINLP